MTTHYRRVIQISCEDSPNVRLARMEMVAGREPSGRTVVPGVISWHTLQHHRQVWDVVRQTVGLDGQFYEGAQLLLFPPDWMNLAAERHRQLQRDRVKRVARAIGVDPGEGGANTSFAVVDELGIIDLVSLKTSDTSTIAPMLVSLMDRYQVPPERVALDRGGGGKQVADHIRSGGVNNRRLQVRTVGFGDSVNIDPRRGMIQIETRLDDKEDRYAYVNRRAEMYGEFSELLKPQGEVGDQVAGFAVPGVECGPVYVLLRKELGPMDKLWDKEGRRRMRAKNRVGKEGEERGEKTLVELIGNSPDEADAVVLACHAMLHRAPVSRAGVA